MVGLHMSISQYCVFKISKGTMPLKDVYPKECVATPLRTPHHPPPLAPRVGPLKGLFEKVPL